MCPCVWKPELKLKFREKIEKVAQQKEGHDLKFNHFSNSLIQMQQYQY